jgi:hypothetical protein
MRLKGTWLLKISQIDSRLNFPKIGKKAKISQNQPSLNHFWFLTNYKMNRIWKHKVTKPIDSKKKNLEKPFSHNDYVHYSPNHEGLA